MDDTILMGSFSTTIARHFKNILDRFLSALWGATNDSKSDIYNENILRQKGGNIEELWDLKQFVSGKTSII